MPEPVDSAVLTALQRYDTPTVCNAIETFEVRPHDEGFAGMDVHCIFPDLGVIVGYAATGTIRSRGEGSYRAQSLISHVGSVPAPRIVVVQDLDAPEIVGSLWGEVNATAFTALGCIGVVTDGSVRDLEPVHALGFQLFARGVGVSHGYVRVESAGEPVTVAGLTVRPWDLIHADQHGVVLVPHEIAAEIPAAADRIISEERDLIAWIRSPEFRAEELHDE